MGLSGHLAAGTALINEESEMTGAERHRQGFTLVEMLVVILLIAVLIAILLPALVSARRAAEKVACSSNMRQFGVAFTNYATQHKGIMPPCSGNIYFYLRPFMGAAHTVTIDSQTSGTTNDIYRCKSDTKNALDVAGTSYCFNFVGSNDEADTEADTVYDLLQANREYAPFSTKDATNSLGETQLGEAKNLSNPPGDTFLMVEFWGVSMAEDRKYGVLDLDNEAKQAKHALHLDEDGDGNPYTQDDDYYTENAEGKLEKGDSAQEWLWNFVDDTAFEFAYHQGQVNILSVDNHVDSYEVVNVGGKPLADGSGKVVQVRWTALKD